MYSAIARYHYYSRNLDFKDTLEELFGSRSVIPSVEIGSHFSILVEQLSPHYPIENLLANHTIYLFLLCDVPFKKSTARDHSGCC